MKQRASTLDVIAQTTVGGGGKAVTGGGGSACACTKWVTREGRGKEIKKQK